MMKRNVCLWLVCLVVLFARCSVVCADRDGDDAPLVLSKMGVMFVGGRTIPMTASTGRRGATGQQTQVVDQAPVHYLVPPKNRRGSRHPVVMVPGMGLTSYIYMATPDGRDGWAQIFVRAGYPVYVLDEPGNAVSGFDVGPFNKKGQDDAEEGGSARFMLWSNEMVWRRWGIGPKVGTPFDDTRYPVKHIEQLYRSLTPVSSTGGAQRGGRGGGRRRRGGRAAGEAKASPKTAALIALLEKTGPAILVLHSASGPTGFDVARQRPDLVEAIVAVEVTGTPTDARDIKDHFAGIPFVAVFGDHFDVRPMAGRYEACKTTVKLIGDVGGTASMIHLPSLGIKGNTHLMMQDNNNDDIARRIIETLEK